MQAIATNRTRAALEPMRKAMCDSLGAVHMQFSTELNGMYTSLFHAQMNLREMQRQYAMLQEECSQVRAERANEQCAREEAQRRCERLLEEGAKAREERDMYEKICELLKVQRENAIEEIRKMNENIPRLVVDYYQMKSEHETLKEEVVALREANVLLREKVQARELSSECHPGPSSPVMRKEGVKTEVPGSPVAFKQEHDNAVDPPSGFDDDAECALGMYDN